MFQNSVVTKYLKSQDKEIITAKWNLFKEHFHNPTIQENIRNSKEEQYQGEFLIDLFVNVLGYTKNPTPNFNITTEYKNVKDSKKADGAIIIDDVVKAVIELKGTDTTDLGKVEAQAFGYKNNQPECTFIVTSNFEKLRFYIDNAIEHFEFNLFSLNEKEFELMYLCLAYENIKKDIPKKIKKESVSQEDAITKKLYNDYSLFKRELHQSLVVLNPQFDALTLFKKSQKLLDRFLFLFFAEDRQLLPPNSVRLILEQWVKLKDLDAYTPLFERFKKYFGYLNTGFKGKQYDVYAYNGGLFKPDKILDTIVIDDELLYKHTLKLSEYDFNSEIDVNILGHIFENSLNEIEEIQAELEGQSIDKSKTKRKKDGVFYTPKYITKYIVDNTVGKLCEEKKAELNIVDEEYAKGRRNRKKDTIITLASSLQKYKEWLLNITICDPACGSGAFLNQALDFLIKEHLYIAELDSQLQSKAYNTGTQLALSSETIEAQILENNLFGVDINEESVEIAKLSLWLRTAQPNRKLNDLSNNIKCGNSLIDDTEIAGEKAFNWKNEFPSVFEKGGFDIVIGNPPWGAKVSKNQSSFIKSRYLCKKGELETYVHFIDLVINTLLRNNGALGLITPNTWYYLDKYFDLRNFLIEKEIIELIELEKNIFDDAPDIIPAIFIIKNNTSSKTNLIRSHILNKGQRPSYLIDRTIMSSQLVNIKNWEKFDNLTFNLKLDDSISNLIIKISNNCVCLNDLYKVRYGIKTGNNSKYVKQKDEIDFKLGNWKYCISSASSVKRYSLIWENYMLNFGDYLSGYSNNTFERKKILIQYIRKLSMDRRLIATPDTEGKFYPLNNFSFVEEKSLSHSLDYLLTIINSNLMNFYFKNVFIDYNIKPKYIEKLPIKKISEIDQKPFVEKADQMLALNKELHETSQKFQRALEREFELDSLPKKLQDWYLLFFADFIKEIEKKNIKLTLSQKAEWEDYFLKEQQKALELKSKIDATDKEIDQMVYELYGLKEEEIEIVENS